MTHRRLRRLAWLFNLLAYICWGFTIFMIVSNLKSVPSTTSILLSVVLPAALGVLFGIPAGWFSRQKNALKKKWEEQLAVVPFLLWAIEGATTPEQREVLRCLWYESGTNVVVPAKRVLRCSENSTLDTLLFSCEFLDALEEGLVSETSEGFVIGEKVFAMARCRCPLDDFSDSTVHAPFFPRLLQTA